MAERVKGPEKGTEGRERLGWVKGRHEKEGKGKRERGRGERKERREGKVEQCIYSSICLWMISSFCTIG